MLLFCFVFALNMKTWHNWTIWRGRLPSSRPPFTQPIQTRNGQLIPTHYRHLNVLLICPKCSESHAKINKHGHDDGAAPSTWYRRYKERKTTEKRCQSKLENVKGGGRREIIAIESFPSNRKTNDSVERHALSQARKSRIDFHWPINHRLNCNQPLIFISNNIRPGH